MTYNAKSRPTRFESADGATVIDCTYDYMGRRHTRKVTVNGTVSNYLRYIYRGYLQIAAIDAVSGVFRWFLFWDPTQPTATRPLAIRKDGTWYAYGWDLTKNVTEVFGPAGYIRTTYTYTPYGEATATGDVTQPFTWSSEYADEELALIYYNYRHYNPADGRWINRDPIAEQGGWNLYCLLHNYLSSVDCLGKEEFTIEERLESLSGLGIGAEITYRGKILIKIDGENFFITTQYPPDGHLNPTGRLYVYRPENPRKQYRLDYHQLDGKYTWHHNNNGLRTIKYLKRLQNHSTQGATCAARMITVFKLGGRAVFVLGAISGSIEIYKASDRTREVIRQVSGIAGGALGAWGGTKLGAGIGTAVGGPIGTIIGGIAGSLIGGTVGWFVAAETAVTIYDWQFKSLEKEEYIVCDELKNERLRPM